MPTNHQWHDLGTGLWETAANWTPVGFPTGDLTGDTITCDSGHLPSDPIVQVTITTLDFSLTSQAASYANINLATGGQANFGNATHPAVISFAVSSANTTGEAVTFVMYGTSTLTGDG